MDRMGEGTRMTFSKKQRKVTVALAGSALWFTLWGMGGYFFGLRGVGYGWPAFWAVGGIGLIIPVFVLILGVIIGFSEYWIRKGK